MEDKSSKNKKGGRIPKKDPAVFRYSIKLNHAQNTQFLSLYELSGMQTKSHFILARIFNQEFKVIKIDRNAVDYYTKLTALYAQFRSVGVNYNQITKEMHCHFSEKKALAFLYKLESLTMQLVQTNQQVIKLTKEFEEKWLQKSI